MITKPMAAIPPSENHYSKQPSANFCRWCARPISGNRTAVATFFCRAECAVTLGWHAASKRGIASNAYEAAIAGTSRPRSKLSASRVAA